MLLGVVIVVFLIFNLKPGDPARMLADQRGSDEALENIRKDLGLDLSLSNRFLLYLNDLSPLSLHNVQDPSSHYFLDSNKYHSVPLTRFGDNALVLKRPYLRRSYRSRRDVSDLLAETFPTTAVLAITAIVLALIMGIVLGTWAALRKGSLSDTLILGFSAVGMSGPSFFMAVIISWIGGFLWFESIPVPLVLMVCPVLGVLLAVQVMYFEFHFIGRLRPLFGSLTRGFAVGALLGSVMLATGHLLGLNFLTHTIALPGTGLPTGGSLVDLDPFMGSYLSPRNLILPAITLGIRPLSVVVQLTRSSLLDVLSQDHVRTARAKGLSERQVVVKHGLRNALIPVVTTISGWLASLLAGAIFVEFVFGWKGMGLEVFNALENDDFPVVMGAVLAFSAIFVTMNIVVDLLYGVLDPRVRTQ